MKRITGTLSENQYTILIITHSVLFGKKNVSGKNCTENQNTHFIPNNLDFRVTVYRSMEGLFRYVSLN